MRRALRKRGVYCKLICTTMHTHATIVKHQQTERVLASCLHAENGQVVKFKVLEIKLQQLRIRIP